MEKHGVCPGEGDEPVKTATDRPEAKTCGTDLLSKMADTAKEAIAGGITRESCKDAVSHAGKSQ